MALPRLLLVIFGLCLLIVQSRGALFQYPPNLLHFLWTQSATDGKTLFLDGGELAYGNRDGTTATSVVLACTIYVDLTVPWTNDTVQFNYIAKPTDFPFSRDTVLWHNPTANQIQSFTGWWYDGADIIRAWMCDGTQRDRNVGPTPPNLPRPWMWSLSYSNDGWAPSKPQPGVDIQPMRGALATQSANAVYALGSWGETYVWEHERAEPGLLIYDFAQQQWQNTSSAGYGYMKRGFASMGRAEYTDAFGDKGVIVYLSGYAPIGPQLSIFAGSSQGTLQSFAELYIYDIASQTFFTQSTSGRIPLARYAFCSVGVSKGTNSFDIYIYGGYTESGAGEAPTDSLQSIYVLSLPSFVWTEIPYSSAGMRGGHTCELVGNRQMIVFGGSQPNEAPGTFDAEPWGNAINVFDLSRWRWANEYNPHAAPYKQNPELARLNAQMTFPRSWDSKLSRSIFYHKGAANGRNGSGGGKVKSANSGRNANPTDGGGTNISVIVGGTVGGVVFILIIAAVTVTLLVRRRRKRRLRKGQVKYYSKPEVDNYASDSKRVWPAARFAHEMDSNARIHELQQNERVHELDGGYYRRDSRPTRAYR